MKIIYFGSGRFGINCLNAIAASPHQIKLVVTQPAARAGRGRNPAPTPVARWAADSKVNFVETKDVNSPAVIEQISALAADLLLVIDFGHKLGSSLLKLGSLPAINVHPSLLPKYRGAAPVNWAIINGETHTGISIIKLSEKIDSGDILAQSEIAILPGETAGELYDRLAQLAAPVLLDTLEKIADGTIIRSPQDNSYSTSAPKLKKSDGFLDFSEPAAVIRRRILGLWPWPGASAAYLSATTGRVEPVTIAAAELVDCDAVSDAPVGTLDECLEIICGQNRLKITKIKPASGRLMAFSDFVNGRKCRPGDAFKRIIAFGPAGPPQTSSAQQAQPKACP